MRGEKHKNGGGAVINELPLANHRCGQKEASILLKVMYPCCVAFIKRCSARADCVRKHLAARNPVATKVPPSSEADISTSLTSSVAPVVRLLPRPRHYRQRGSGCQI